MSHYRMSVRAVEAPHEVLGRLIVPYAAAVGDMPVVNFEMRGRSDPRGVIRTIERVAIGVNLFVVRGHSEFALVVPRDKWTELKERIA